MIGRSGGSSNQSERGELSEISGKFHKAWRVTNLKTQQRFDEFLKFTLSVYAEYGNKNITVFDGIYEMLDTLKNKGFKCAVLSNKPHEITVDVCKSFFGDMFEAVYGHRQDKPKKPDPTVIFDILDEVGLTKEECVYCGDSSVDVDTAKNAGITIFGAAWGFYGKEPFETADAILTSPMDIIKYI